METNQTAAIEKVEAKAYDLSSNNGIRAMFEELSTDDAKRKFVSDFLKEISEKHQLNNYHIVLLHDEESLDEYHAGRIFEAAVENNREKDILLVINSPGGRIEPAYLISKMCKKLSKQRFVVAIPRQAKSAATLLSLGADEIHMGLMSELGPIDLQIIDASGIWRSALCLRGSLESLSRLVQQFPASSQMFGVFLAQRLSLLDLGNLERMGEVSAQYAERLLGDKPLGKDQDGKKVARRLVYEYNIHNFVIDIEEAKEILGEMVKEDTPEYRFANQIYKCFSFLDHLYSEKRSQRLSFVGTLEKTFNLKQIPRPT